MACEGHVGFLFGGSNRVGSDGRFLFAQLDMVRIRRHDQANEKPPEASPGVGRLIAALGVFMSLS